MLTQTIHVNFSSLTVPHLISVVQGDTGRNLKCIVDDFTLDGAWTATWYIERPSDVPVYNTATIETSDNSVNLELTAQSINEVGDNKLQVRILDADEQVVTSFACILSVKPFGGIGAVESSTEANIFDQQVEEAFDEIDTHKADALEEIDTEIDTHVADGKFPNMAAGDIISDLYDENKTPYFFRTSGGGAEVGTIEAPVLVGGSVGWNQLVQNGNFADGKTNWYGSRIGSVTDGFLSVNIAGAWNNDARQDTDTISGHVYLGALACKTSSSNQFTLSFGQFNTSQDTYFLQTGTVTSTKTRYEGISKATASGANVRVELGMSGASFVGDTFEITDVQLIDLTLLLGSTIADRLYTMEQSTAGSGIAQLKAWGFDFDEYIPYTAPTLKHVEGVSAHVMRDANDNIIGNYPLDASLTLRGVPKLDANNQMYFDGDTYEPDGTVTRKYGVVDLGTLNWEKSGVRFYCNAISTSPTPAIVANTDVADIVCSIYIASSRTTIESKDKAISLHGDAGARYITVVDSAYSDVASFKTAMSGVYLVYPLATATTETATPFAEYQEVDANGTEEYVSTGVVPVGHDTKYPTDLKGTLETILSAIPSANGTYALKVTVANGKKTFSWV